MTPTGDDSDNSTRLELKNDLEWAPGNRTSQESKTIVILLIALDPEIGKERFDSFFKCHAVSGEFVVFKVIFEIGRLKRVSPNPCRF
ncbi:MAG: hypothetical protein QOE68_2471 [Thermoanaerobaculia bacterium]|jgi:hypothetical protein|nr:hypothetical protein [Thermoanaerobaculia bacterium]